MPILPWLTRDEDLRATRRAPYRLLEEALGSRHGDPVAGRRVGRAHLVVGDTVQFVLAGRQPVTGVGLINQDGALEAFGLLSGAATSSLRRWTTILLRTRWSFGR